MSNHHHSRNQLFSGTMALVQQANQLTDKNVVDLGLGVSGFANGLNHSKAAVSCSTSTYGAVLGNEELRIAISEFLQVIFTNAHISADRITVTDGGSNALMLAIMHMLKSGREIIIPEISYPAFNFIVANLGGQVVTAPVDRLGRVQLAALPELVSQNTAGIVLNSPSNPTGAKLQDQDYRFLASLNLPIAFDEVYAGLGFEASILQYSNKFFAIGSFSKLFAAPGIRIGYLVSPEDAMSSIFNLRLGFNVTASQPNQNLAMSLLAQADSIIPNHRAYRMQQQDLALDIASCLNLPVRYASDSGGFYLCLDTTAVELSSLRFAQTALQKYGVICCPGSDFAIGDQDPCFVRLNYMVDPQTLTEGLRRLSLLYDDSRINSQGAELRLG